eukprot:Sro300_g111630.1 n/a (147) ;mRNA; f:12908-13439
MDVHGAIRRIDGKRKPKATERSKKGNGGEMGVDDSQDTQHRDLQRRFAKSSSKSRGGKGGRSNRGGGRGGGGGGGGRGGRDSIGGRWILPPGIPPIPFAAWTANEEDGEAKEEMVAKEKEEKEKVAKETEAKEKEEKERAREETYD